ncbi:MAG: serine protease [Pontiella sp.]|nr:serine protease [Pontiella sp.]
MLRLLLSILALWLLPFLGFAEALDGYLFTVQREGEEAGSGFLLHDRGKSWLVSNRHVVEGNEKVVFVGMTDASRTYELQERIQVATNRDAVRFRVDEPEGFALGGDCSFDDEVFAFGNSDGKGVVTKSAGKVIGKGRGEIEVTCEIIPGNSGGPVVNSEDKVIGLATFIIVPPSEHGTQRLSNLKMFEGTRYEETRRFAVPLHDAKWQEVELATFQSEAVDAAALYGQYDQFYGMTAGVFLHYRLSEGDGEVLSRSWVRSYNRKLGKCGYRYGSGRFVVRSGKQDSLERALQGWQEDLSEAALEVSKTLRKEAEDFTVKYYQLDLLERADDLEEVAKQLLEHAAD